MPVLSASRSHLGKVASLVPLVLAAIPTFGASAAQSQAAVSAVDAAPKILEVEAPLPPAAEEIVAPPEPAAPVLRIDRLAGRGRVELSPFSHRGEVDAEAMEELSTLFSHHAARGAEPGQEELVAIDPRLAELLLRISAELGDAPIVLVSGHRKPGRGTSRKSYHVRGMAADISVDGVKPRDVRAAAVRAGASGIGLYRGFVHVDVRDEPYWWGGGGKAPRRPQRPPPP